MGVAEAETPHRALSLEMLSGLQVCEPFSPRCLRVSQWLLFREILRAGVRPTYSLPGLGNKVTYLPGSPHRASSPSRMERK